MRGSYSSYTSYNLDVVGLTAITPIQIFALGDLNKDGDCDDTNAAVSSKAARARGRGEVGDIFGTHLVLGSQKRQAGAGVRGRPAWAGRLRDGTTRRERMGQGEQQHTNFRQ